MTNPTVHGVLKARILKWFAIPFSSGPHSVRPLHHDPPILGCPTGMAWFHWVRQGCGPNVIRLTSFLWVWFQCVCPLMPSCHTYHLTWVSLSLGVGYLFTAAPAKHSCCSLPWTRDISLPPLFLTLKTATWTLSSVINYHTKFYQVHSIDGLKLVPPGHLLGPAIEVLVEVDVCVNVVNIKDRVWQSVS